MAKTIKDKITEKLAALRAEKGEVEDNLEVLRERSINEPNNQQLIEDIDFEERKLDKIKEQIEDVKSDKEEYDGKAKEASEYKWKDIEPLVIDAAKKHHMSFCVETNKFIYCMDMASTIKDETGAEYTVVNPQFRMFEATRIQQVVSKLIDKYMVDNHHQLIKWFMTNKGYSHFQATASFLYSKWNSDKVYNKAGVISQYWVQPDMVNYKDYHKDFDILLYCVGGGKVENIEHLEKWALYKFWFPERVSNTPNLDICGPLGANGKGRYLEMCKTIFTYGCVSPGTAKELNDGFNASWEMSTLVYFDEPTEKELPEAKVKNATGGDEQRIEKKGVDAYTADRNYSIMALSNNEKGVFKLNGGGMAGQDRRFSVISTDVVMIDEIMKRENCTFKDATERVNNIAQLVKNRNEVAKWMGHIMMKHDIVNLKVLPPLHGEDYNKRFEDQKDRTETIFDKIYPIFEKNGCIPLPFLVTIMDNLLSTDKKPVSHAPKTVSTKFQQYLQKKRVDFGIGPKQYIKVMYDGKEVKTLEQKTMFYFDKNVQNNTFNFNDLSTRSYDNLNHLNNISLTFSLD